MTKKAYSTFTYQRGQLHAEGVSLSLLAQRVGTPVYVYSAGKIRERYRAFDKAFQGFPHTICYAMKANSNLAILRLLAREGAGVDIVSGGELYRAQMAGVPANKIVFSGVGKTESEITLALKAGIHLFNVESAEELRRAIPPRTSRTTRDRPEWSLRCVPPCRERAHGERWRRGPS